MPGGPIIFLDTHNTIRKKKLLRRTIRGIYTPPWTNNRARQSITPEKPPTNGLASFSSSSSTSLPPLRRASRSREKKKKRSARWYHRWRQPGEPRHHAPHDDDDDDYARRFSSSVRAELPYRAQPCTTCAYLCRTPALFTPQPVEVHTHNSLSSLIPVDLWMQ